jgi:hypothetical protein
MGNHLKYGERGVNIKAGFYVRTFACKFITRGLNPLFQVHREAKAKVLYVYLVLGSADL